MSENTEQTKTKDAANPLRKLAIDMGPLLVFFVANYVYGIIWATGALVVATLVAVVVAYVLERRIPVMPLVAAGFVGAFGGLTVFFEDETFIKIKPTVVSALFGAFLLVGYALGRSPLKMMMGAMLEMTEEGWRKLTLRWGLFFFFLAGLNEVVWRMVSTDTWVSFKVFGLLPLTMVFAIAQTRLMQRYAVEPED